MKSSKILLILASAALLASCNGGTSSSTPASSSASASGFSSSASSEPSSSASEPSSEPTSESTSASTSEEASYTEVDPATGKQKLLAAVAKSIDNDKIALAGRVSANADAHSIMGGNMVSSSMVYPEGKVALNGGYEFGISVAGLKETNPDNLKGMAALKGQHELKVELDDKTPVFENKMELDEAAYFSHKIGYFNFSETFAALMEQATGYPYGSGKVHTPEADIPEGVFPLINDEIVNAAVEKFEMGLAYGEQLFPNELKYITDGEKYGLELALDADLIVTLIGMFGGQDVAAMYGQAVKALDIEECLLGIGYDEDGLQAIHLGIHADLDKTYGELVPPEAGLPDELKDKKVTASLGIDVDLAFAYGLDFELPADLDTYEEASLPHHSSAAVSSEELPDLIPLDDLVRMAGEIEDPGFSKLDVLGIDPKSGEKQHVYEIDTDNPMWEEQVANSYKFHLTPLTVQQVSLDINAGNLLNAGFYFYEDKLWGEFYAMGNDGEQDYMVVAAVSYDPETFYATGTTTVYQYADKSQSVTMAEFHWSSVN